MVPFSRTAPGWPGTSLARGPTWLRGEGHLTLAVRQFGAVLDDLLDLAGRPAGAGARPAAG